MYKFSWQYSDYLVSSQSQNKIAQDPDVKKFEEEDIIVKVGECLEAIYLFPYPPFLLLS